jgi:hypothetical protein
MSAPAITRIIIEGDADEFTVTTYCTAAPTTQEPLSFAGFLAAVRSYQARGFIVQQLEYRTVIRPRG